MTESEIRVLLGAAYALAERSPDTSTQNGALVIGQYHGMFGKGRNEFPRGVKHLPERFARPKKYEFTEHAERNAIYDAARHGITTDGATMVCPWFACADCARGIIQSGIIKVIGHKRMFDETPEHWKGSIASAFEMLNEAGVETTLYPEKLDLDFTILFNGSPWRP